MDFKSIILTICAILIFSTIMNRFSRFMNRRTNRLKVGELALFDKEGKLNAINDNGEDIYHGVVQITKIEKNINRDIFTCINIITGGVIFTTSKHLMHINKDIFTLSDKLVRNFNTGHSRNTPINNSEFVKINRSNVATMSLDLDSIDMAINDVKNMIDESLDIEDRARFKSLTDILNILSVVREELI